MHNRTGDRNETPPFPISPLGESNEDDSRQDLDLMPRQQWTLSMRPLATKQRSAAGSNAFHFNQRDVDNLTWKSGCCLSRTQDIPKKQTGTRNKTITPASNQNHVAPASPAPTNTTRQQLPPQSPPLLQPKQQPTETLIGNYESCVSGRLMMNSVQGIMAGAPLLPGSPDLSIPTAARFPEPLFSPVAGGATEFRPGPELLMGPELRRPIPRPHISSSPPSIPLSPELAVRPARSLQMKRCEPLGLDEPFV